MSELPPNDPLPGTGQTSLPQSGGAMPSSVVPSTAAMGDAADVEKNKVFAVLAYIGILVLVPILAAKDSPFAKYHANQGLVLFIACVIISVIFVPVMIGMSFIPGVNCLVPVLGMVVSLGLVAFMILGIINAINGKMVPLPLIGQFKILK